MNTSTKVQQNFENIISELDMDKILFAPNHKGVITYEKFKDIPGYEGSYQVSDFGRVKSLTRKIKHYRGGESLLIGRISKQNMNRYGYYVVGLRKVKETKIKVHQLVAMAFLGHKPCGHKLVVDHIDNIKANNFLWNLQIITQRENSSKDKKNYSSRYTGVSLCAKTKKFQAFIQIRGKNTYLGTFNNEVEAAEYYEYSLKRLDENIAVKKPNFYSKYKGISFDKKSKKWLARIRKDGNVMHVGRFNTEQEAYESQQKALANMLI